jgi:hypothetical protein
MSLLGLTSEVVGMLDLLHMILPVSTVVYSHLRFALTNLGRSALYDISICP